VADPIPPVTPRPLPNLPSTGGTPAGGEAARLRAAAQQFEALFWEQVLHAALPPDQLMGSDIGAGVYGGLVETGLADAVARAGGAGLWTLLVRSLQAHPGRGGT
jgi:Rod binding domain-containing protein